MNLEKLKELVDKFNDGEWEEFAPHFNDNLEMFLKIVTRHGLMEMIDPLNEELQDQQNLIFYELMSINPEKWTHFIAEKVINNDITIRDGKYYLHLRDREDLSELFYHSNRESTRNLVASMLKEDWWEPYWDTTNDVYGDVIEELTPKNLELVKNKMFQEIDGVVVPTETDLLEEISNGEDTIVITKKNFQEMFNDEKTCKFLLKNYADDTRQELYSVHNNAYNTAFTDEFYESAWNELETFFVGRPIDFSAPIMGTDKKRYWEEIEIKFLQTDIQHFLSAYKDDSYNYTLEYNGSYLGMLKEGMDSGVWEWLDFRVPDYPDSRKVDKYINDGISDYF
jgi:hypothetical protein